MPPAADALAELLRAHAADHQAHRDTDVIQLLANQGEPFITVGEGRVASATRAEVAAFFTEYFAGVTYHEYVDLEPPRAMVSADGTLGWVISRTRVRRTQTQPDGQALERSFVYAGFMGYVREAGQWLRVANVSTFEPVER
jgi:hypothetical protein